MKSKLDDSPSAGLDGGDQDSSKRSMMAVTSVLVPGCVGFSKIVSVNETPSSHPPASLRSQALSPFASFSQRQ